MTTLLVAVLSFFGFIVAYRTYGRWLGRKVFGLDDAAPTPAHQMRDDVDYVPTRRPILFGHHFTSIAGTGPIVGPAIAVFWGWLPALLWVVFGSIFLGAVHDFGGLVVSIRNEGKSIGEVAGRIISPRARLLLLLVLVLELTIVLAIFGLVIAVIFKLYPESVPAVWVSLPIAIFIGLWIRRSKGASLIPPVLAALALIYAMIWLGTKYLITPRMVSDAAQAVLGWVGLRESLGAYANPVVVWTVVLFIYCFFASVLPVWLLLQPRDYINSNQLFLALALILIGLAGASLSGAADINTAPAITPAADVPADAPPILPFLFITIACGAVSGFHSLVSSGTSSKQLAMETHAQAVGYGGMLAEGALAVVVILACCAGVGMGAFQRTSLNNGAEYRYERIQTDVDGEKIDVAGRAAWNRKYSAKIEPVIDPETGTQKIDKATGKGVTQGGWANQNLARKVGAFIEGGANFLSAIGMPLEFGVGILAVLVACFAATTLDSATRLQRYVIQELGATIRVRPLTNKYVATLIAVVSACALAMLPAGPGQDPGTGGLILWPLFGSANQLLAGLGFLVILFFLVRRGRPTWFLLLPIVMMIVLPAWAMLWEMFSSHGWLAGERYLLFGIGAVTQLLLIWIIVEAVLAWKRAKRQGLLAKDDAANA